MFSMQQLGRQIVSRSAPRSCLTGGGPKKILRNPAAASLSSLSCPFETYAATAPVHDEADWRFRTKKFTHAALMAQEANSTLPQEKTPATAADDTASSWRVRSLRFTYPALMAEASIPETASAAAPRERPLQAAGPARFDQEKTAAADWRMRSSKFTHAALTMAEQASSTLPQETPAADAASSWRARSLKFTYPALMMAETANTRPETTMTSAAAAAQELPLQAAGPNARVDHEKTAAADWRVRTRKSTHAALTMAEQANSTPPQETPADDAASSWRVRSLQFTHPALMAEATFEENQRAAGSLEEPSFLIHQEAAHEQILLLIGEEEGDLARQ